MADVDRLENVLNEILEELRGLRQDLNYFDQRIRGEFNGTDNIEGSCGSDLDDIHKTLKRIELEIG